MDRAEFEASNQRSLDEFRIIRRGQAFGFSLGLAGLIAAVLSSLASPGAGGVWIGSVLGGGSLVTLVAVFVAGRESPTMNAERIDEAPR